MGIKVCTKKIAPIVGVSPATLESWRSRNHPHQPPYYVINGRVSYDVEETERWVQSCRVARRGS